MYPGEQTRKYLPQRSARANVGCAILSLAAMLFMARDPAK